MHAANLDGDAYLEIAAGGWALINNTYNGEIHVFYWEGGGSDPITSEPNAYTYWYTTGNTRVNSVYNGNADPYSDIEVSSGGQAHDGSNDRGELRIYRL